MAGGQASLNCARFLITGRVQGVFFRDSTRQRANALGVTGYAKNLANGRVEVLAWGSEVALNDLEAWLWEGPRMAEVSDVERQDTEQEEAPAEFRIR